MSNEPEPERPSTALSRSIGGSDLASGLATIGDAGLDAGLTALHSVPILGVIAGLFKGARDVHKILEFRKIVRFLDGIESASAERRLVFSTRLEKEGKMEEFGENLLLLLDRLDDIAKPTIVGRIMAAHIDGHLEYGTALRLCAMVARSYAVDMKYLLNFRPGLQNQANEIAAMLAADGLLLQIGIDSGNFDDPNSSGYLYDLSSYGRLLLRYGLF